MRVKNFPTWCGILGPVARRELLWRGLAQAATFRQSYPHYHSDFTLSHDVFSMQLWKACPQRIIPFLSLPLKACLCEAC